MKKFAMILLAAMMLCVSLALAEETEFTFRDGLHWGMTPEEVLKAEQRDFFDEVYAVGEGEVQRLLKKVQMETFEATLVCNFINEGLVSLSVAPSDQTDAAAAVEVLRQLLTQTYGQPDDPAAFPGIEWAAYVWQIDPSTCVCIVSSETDGVYMCYYSVEVGLPEELYTAPMFTAAPTAESTATPTAESTATPTAEPTATPTAEPTATATPTAEPTATATPTAEPTATPTAEPTATATPTAEPTATPTAEPTATATPTAKPTATPTAEPTAEPTATPTCEPNVPLDREDTTCEPNPVPDDSTPNTGYEDNNEFVGSEIGDDCEPNPVPDDAPSTDREDAGVEDDEIGGDPEDEYFGSDSSEMDDFIGGTGGEDCEPNVPLDRDEATCEPNPIPD